MIKSWRSAAVVTCVVGGSVIFVAAAAGLPLPAFAAQFISPATWATMQVFAKAAVAAGVAYGKDTIEFIANNKWAFLAGTGASLLELGRRIRDRRNGKHTSGPLSAPPVQAASPEHAYIRDQVSKLRSGTLSEIHLFHGVTIARSPIGHGFEMILRDKDDKGFVYPYFSKTPDGLLDLVGIQLNDPRKNPGDQDNGGSDIDEVLPMGAIKKDGWQERLKQVRLAFVLRVLDHTLANDHPIRGEQQKDGSLALATRTTVTNIIPLEDDFYRINLHVDPKNRRGLMQVPRSNPLDTVVVKSREHAEAVATALYFGQRSLVMMQENDPSLGAQMANVWNGLLGGIANDLGVSATDATTAAAKSVIGDPLKAAEKLAKFSVSAFSGQIVGSVWARMRERIVEALGGKLMPDEWTRRKGTLFAGITAYKRHQGQQFVIADVGATKAALRDGRLEIVDLTQHQTSGQVFVDGQTIDWAKGVDPRIVTAVKNLGALAEVQPTQRGHYGLSAVDAHGLSTTIFSGGEKGEGSVNHGVILVDRLFGRNTADWMTDDMKKLMKASGERGLLSEAGVPFYLESVFDEPLIAHTADLIQRNWRTTHLSLTKDGDQARWKDLNQDDAVWIQKNKGRYPADTLRQKNDGSWELNIAQFDTNSTMPPSRQAGNRESAIIMLNIKKRNPNASSDVHKALLHGAWQKRETERQDTNHELLKDYEKLSDDQKVRVTSVYDAAVEALKSDDHARVLAYKPDTREVHVFRRSDVKHHLGANVDTPVDFSKSLGVIKGQVISLDEARRLRQKRPEIVGPKSAPAVASVA